MTEHMEPRRTRLVVDIEWRGHPGADPGDEYYTDDELTGVAARWITDAFYDRDGSPHVTVTGAGAGAPADRGRHSGEALTAVRTVLSRAETALDELGPDGFAKEWPPRTGDRELDDYGTRKAAKFEDPNAPAMREALRAVVSLLAPWRKTGRTARSTCL